jgi:hypothetical protein
MSDAIKRKVAYHPFVCTTQCHGLITAVYLARKAKVTQLDLVVLIHQQIMAFQVPTQPMNMGSPYKNSLNTDE